MADAIERKVIATISRFSRFSPSYLDVSSSLDGLEMDIIAVIEFTLALEWEFGIGIPEEQLERWKTIGDICQYVRSVCPAPLL